MVGSGGGGGDSVALCFSYHSLHVQETVWSPPVPLLTQLRAEQVQWGSQLRANNKDRELRSLIYHLC